eukprot:TRINITY_DN58481_c0_g1_i1.p1 TRINITY_DN58481_c0_g1~~TRINITY_DN58481_c0_g1_i1.p1  ORF type:complete len:414 (+),score=124.05 TRINITY_DN58481_c0_g1_i1:92-1333(+)
MTTRITQRNIGDPRDALEAFAQGGNEIPVVLIPDDRWSCSCILTVPSGANSIIQSWGADHDEKTLAAPGLHCLPSWHQIAYCVTKQANTYKAPIQSCPTSDNVMVDCDLTIVFRITDEPTQVRNFVYNLGALRFDEFLRAAVEEGVRQLVRATPHDQIYELRGGSHVDGMLKELNHKFRNFGVNFTQCAITDVKFHGDLEKTLQATTQFDSQIKEEQKNNDFQLKKIAFQLDRDMNDLKRTNDRTLQNLEAARQRSLIERERSEIDANSHLKISVTKAEESAAVDITRAMSEKQVAQSQGKRGVEEMLAIAKSEAESLKIKVDQECETMVYESEKRVEAAKFLAEALRIEAESEGRAAKSLKVKREYELEMAKLEVLELLAKKGKIIISGSNGDKLINSLISGDNLDHFGALD